MHQTAPPSTPEDTTSAPVPAPAAATLVVGEESGPGAQSSDGKLLVTAIVVAGADDDEQEDLAPRLARFLNRELTMNEIQDAARVVTRFFRERGYLVARAFAPRQGASGGILTIGLQRGAYGGYTLNNSSLLRTRVAEGVLRRMKAGSPYLTQNSLERAMLLLKEMPGSSLPNISVKPGQKPGETDLLVKLDAARRFRGYLLGDNQGSQFTGRRRVYGGLDLNSPLGLGDQLSLAAMVTDDAALKNGRLSYGYRLNSNGLRVTVSYAHTTYTLGGVYAVLNGTGSADSLDALLSFPIRRRHDESFDLQIDWAHKKMRDDLALVSTHNPRRAELGTATVQRTKYSSLFGRVLYTSMAASIAAGQLNVIDETQRSLAGSDGAYGKFTMRMAAENPLSSKLTAKGTLQIQKNISDKILDSSEQLFISSGGGVRGYSEGASGDNGYALSAELRYALPALRRLALSHTASVFFDNGGVSAQRNATSLTNFELTDVGAGYTANFHQAFVNVQAVRLLGAIRQHNEVDHFHVWLQLGYLF